MLLRSQASASVSAATWRLTRCRARSRGPHSRADRPERRRQDDVAQRHLRACFRRPPAAFYFAAEDYTGRRPDLVLAMGIARNFQQVRLFPGLSVVENIAIGSHSPTGGNRLEHVAAAGLLREGRRRRTGRDKAMELLALVGIETRSDELPSELTLVDAAPSGDRPRAGERTAASPARRAGRRHEPVRDRRTGRTHPPDSRFRRYGRAGRAQHEAGDGESPSASQCSAPAASSPMDRPPISSAMTAVIDAYLGSPL